MKKSLEEYFDRLFPIPRSLTGRGVRDSLAILKEIIDLEITEVPTGTTALDWTVPREWSVKEAFFLTPDGKRTADFGINNLHLVGYSAPFSGRVGYEELCKHIITRPDYPDAIPYATSYYHERWGFCMSYREFLTLPREGEYLVNIDTKLFDGSMTCGEAVLKGSTDYEILFTSYLCHPQMANNELSGPLAIAFLYDQVKKIPKRKYTYRFFIGPETIGAIWYLSKFGEHFRKFLEAGIVATCCGDGGDFTFKRSRRNSYINRLVPHVLAHRSKPKYTVRDFVPMGSDERQYCSPGFDLPVASLSRSMYREYPEYHTSKDNKSIMNFVALEETVLALTEIVNCLELEGKYINLAPWGEPQLGKRDLYPNLMSEIKREKSLERTLYLLNYADGAHTLLDISERIQEPLLSFRDSIAALTAAGLLRKEIGRLNNVL